MASTLKLLCHVQLSKSRSCCAVRSPWPVAVASTKRNTTMTVNSIVSTRDISEAFPKLRKEGKVVLGRIYTGKSDFSTVAQASKVLGSWGSAIFDPGFPCSDPLANDQVIQAAGTHSLGRGTKFFAIKFMSKEVKLEVNLCFLSYLKRLILIARSYSPTNRQFKVWLFLPLSSAIALFLLYQSLKLGIEKFKSIINDAGISGQRPPRNFDIIIIYKWDDTRDFVSHLKAALERRGIRTFVDYTLDEGQEILLAIEEVIKQSNISVVVVSQNFHTSPWCLNELAKILRSQKKRGLIVFPIFWGIDAKELREQCSPFVENIGQGEEGFKQEKPCLVHRWKKALRALGMINGFTVSARLDKTEAEVIEDLADKILAKINCSV